MKHFPLARVIGHRGVPTRLPENTVEGLKLASALGYGWCEIDTQAASDGVAMVHHDFEVRGLGMLAELDSATLAGHVVGKGDNGQKLYIPTLAACMDAAISCGLNLVVEIKSGQGRERADAAAVVEVMSRMLPVKILVSSFSPRALRLFAEQAGDVPLALNVPRIPPTPPEWVSNVHFGERHATQEGVEMLLEAGLGAYSYTVNSTKRMRLLLGMGVHGVFTDDPRLLQEARGT